MTLDEAIKRYFDNAEYERTHGNLQGCLEFRQLAKLLKELKAYRKICHKEHVDDCLRAESGQEPISDKYEYHIDHTDCIWYGNSGCPVTCSQYRDGWNDAMEYIFKGGKGYQPYRR